MYISYKTLFSGSRKDGSLLLLTLSIHEDIEVLTNTCGHGRSSAKNNFSHFCW